MTTWIALFRGVNVGRNNPLPMKTLAGLLTKLGFADVRTYLQSGNVVFKANVESAAPLTAKIAAAVRKQVDFEPHLLLVTADGLGRIVTGNPFAGACREPQSLHVFFLASAPEKPDLAALKKLKSGSEKFVLDGSVFYMHAPDGFGNSKLAARAEKLLGVEATARNWRTVIALQEMSQR